MKHKYNGIEYDGIMKLSIATIGELPKSAIEHGEKFPVDLRMAIIQNEDGLDIWLIDHGNIVQNVENLREYYREEEPWVFKKDGSLEIRLYSLSPEFVYV